MNFKYYEIYKQEFIKKLITINKWVWTLKGIETLLKILKEK